MVSVSTRQAYSEVNSFLNLLDEERKNKIPVKLREFFEREKDSNYKKEIVSTIPIKEQNLKRETLAIIAFLNLQYWCEDEQERQRLMQVYKENEKKYSNDIYERLNRFNSPKGKENSEDMGNDKVELLKVEKESFFNKIIKSIKKLFKMEK